MILPHGSSWTGRELPAVPPDGTHIGGYDAAADGDAQWDEASELRQEEPANLWRAGRCTGLRSHAAEQDSAASF